MQVFAQTSGSPPLPGSGSVVSRLTRILIGGCQFLKAMTIEDMQRLVASLDDFGFQQLTDGVGHRLRRCTRPNCDILVLRHLMNKPATSPCGSGSAICRSSL